MVFTILDICTAASLMPFKKSRLQLDVCWLKVVIHLVGCFANLEHGMVSRLNFAVSLCMVLSPQVLLGCLKHLLFGAVATTCRRLGGCKHTCWTRNYLGHRWNYYFGRLLPNIFKTILLIVEVCCA